MAFKPTELYHSEDLKDAAKVKWDHAIVCCKTTSTRDVSRNILAPILENNNDAIIHLVQNGVGIEEPVLDQFPRNPLVTVSAFIRSVQTAPTIINQSGPKLFTFGFYNPSNPSDAEQTRLETLVKAFEGEGVECKISKDIQWVRFHKLAWNASFNPLSIICGQVGCSAMLVHPPTRELITAIHKEVFDLATRLLGPRPSYLDDYLDFVERTSQIQKRNGEYFPSMLLDFQNGRPLEMEAIIFNAIKMVKANGREMARLESIGQLLTFLDRTRGVPPKR